VLRLTAEDSSANSSSGYRTEYLVVDGVEPSYYLKGGITGKFRAAGDSRGLPAVPLVAKDL
jgi:hypothetical protein